MTIFGGMGERERTIEARVDDDFDMMGMQFSVKQYSVADKIFTDGMKQGLTGFAGQLDLKSQTPIGYSTTRHSLRALRPI